MSMQTPIIYTAHFSFLLFVVFATQWSRVVFASLRSLTSPHCPVYESCTRLKMYYVETWYIDVWVSTAVCGWFDLGVECIRSRCIRLQRLRSTGLQTASDHADRIYVQVCLDKPHYYKPDFFKSDRFWSPAFCVGHFAFVSQNSGWFDTR